MEFALGRSDHESKVKGEKTSESAGSGDEDHRKQKIDIEMPTVGDSSGPIVSSTKQEEVEELESAKMEMGEVREENQRLKQCLDRVMKDYKTLEMQFRDIVQKETNDQSTTISECDKLVSLSLGRVIRSSNNNDSNARNDYDHQKSKASKAILLKKDDEEEEEEDLALGLECKFETSKSSRISINTHHDEANNNNNTPSRTNIASPTNSSHHQEEPHMNNDSKSLQTSRRDGYCGEDEVSQHNPAKKARVCVRARCDAQTMNDGCQWRKYGQKISKGNPCPRAYYRCTVAPSCPVKKQVQRCAEDMSVLVTTYEGMHNHPLPLSATAMASTTSAAASMLLSGSSSSADLYGLNLSDGSIIRSSSSSSSKPLLYYNLPNNHSSSLSSSIMPTSHPTITLDLTTNPSASTFLSSSNYNQPPPRSSSSSYPSSSTSTLNFGVPNNHNFLSYNTNNNNRNNIFSYSMNLARSTTMDNLYRVPPYLQKNPTHHHHHTLPPPPADSIAAATKAITADPKFQSALAVALTSIIGTTASGGAGDNLPHHKMKWGELFPAL